MSVSVSSLAFGYQPDQPVLQDVSLKSGPGITLLTGPNGWGKSTLLELLAGTLKPWSGRISVLGGDPASENIRGRRAVCRAEPTPYFSLTLREHLRFVSQLNPAAPCQKARLSEYGLDQWRETPMNELSTGTLKKAWFVLCTLQPRDLYLLDEPFDGLDTNSVGAMACEIAAWRQSGSDVLIAAHAPPAQLLDLVDQECRFSRTVET